MQSSPTTAFESTADRSTADRSAADRSAADRSTAEPATPLRILIEAAMEQAQLSPTDPALIARQLAGELNKIEASLSDVRNAVQALYQDNRQGAEAYLSYLAQHGFPAANVTQQQVTPARNIDVQDRAIADYQPDAYGQILEGLFDEGDRFYGGNLIAELVANSAFSTLIFGERRSGTSAILRAILYDQIAKSGRTILDILDLHNGQWRGLEDIRLPRWRADSDLPIAQRSRRY